METYEQTETAAREQSTKDRLAIIGGREYRRTRRTWIQGKRRRGWEYYQHRKVRVGDFIKAKGLSYCAIVTGAGTIGNNIPAWLVKDSHGKVSAIPKNQAEFICDSQGVV